MRKIERRLISFVDALHSPLWYRLVNICNYVYKIIYSKLPIKNQVREEVCS